MSKRARGQRAATRVATRAPTLVGQPIRRVEDGKYLTGRAKYTDDIRLPGMLHACFVRSPYAHARLSRVDADEARRAPGVAAVLTGVDLEGKLKPMIEPRVEGEGEGGWGANTAGTVWKALAMETVNFVGEVIAVVLAEDSYAAEDAAELVHVDYETLPAVVDPEQAIEASSPKVHDYLGSNVGSRVEVEAGDVDKAFKRADEVVKVKLYNQRLSPAPMEPRAVAAQFDEGTGVLTVYLSTQDPHGARDELADNLSMPRERVRVIAPEVGGGFGGKAGIYSEDPVICYAAVLTGRPVKWMESRRENLVAMRQGRGQVQFGELALSRAGRILGLKVKVISDGGAYGGEPALTEITLKMVPGVYDIQNYRAEGVVALTNKVPQGAYRGAGRPEASYLIERAINIASARMKLDPVKVRRLNYIRKDRFPYHSAGDHDYDSGDYERNLDKALELSGYDWLLRERARAKAEGRLLGIGLATWIEVSSFGPGWPQAASMTVTEQGRVLVNLGGHSHGQGHATAFAQVVADELGLGLEDVTVQDGDTAMLPWGSLTAGSRSAALSGSATLMCARKIREKMSLVAAHRMKVRPGTKMTFANGTIFRDDQPSKKLKFADVASAAYDVWEVPHGMEPTLFAYSVYAPRSNAYPFGTHVALVEVDRDTGVVRLLKYFAVDDGARLINPLLVEGQLHGGIAQGIGQALTEEVVFDEGGQPLSTTFSDYLVPSADMLPELVLGRTETPTDANLVGVKGLGEAGAIAATPTVMNAIEDALSEYGTTVDRMPASPEYLKSLIDGKSG